MLSPSLVTKSSLGLQRRGVFRGRLSFVFYLVIAFVLLLLEGFAPTVGARARSLAGDMVSPVLTVFETPIRTLQSGMERLAGVSDIYAENERLRAENIRLKQYRRATIELRSENNRLRTMLNVPGREVPIAATGRVIGVGGGAFERSVLLNIGARNRLHRDAPVVDENGVIGRVIEVGRFSSRVLMLTDLNSNIPVRVERNGALGIIRGQNAATVQLAFLPDDTRIEVGDLLLTSGHGSTFPPDLPVARVVSVDGADIVAAPMADVDRLNYVRVMDYNPLPPEEDRLPAEDPEDLTPASYGTSMRGDNR